MILYIVVDVVVDVVIVDVVVEVVVVVVDVVLVSRCGQLQASCLAAILIKEASGE